MKRKLFAAISISLLFVVFGLISFLVILTKRHPFFVKSKLKIGALIISLSGAAAGCFTTTCYSPVPDNYFQIDQYDSQIGMLLLNRAVSDTITGEIRARNNTAYSYTIRDSSYSIFAKDNLKPLDGVFDKSTEEFQIVVGNQIPSGDYNLTFYSAAVDSIDNAQIVDQFSLRITD